METRLLVLSQYARVLRLSRTWTSLDTSATSAERTYIREEATRLFRKNKGIDTVEGVQECLRELDSRIEIGHHYQNPFPRPMNVASTPGASGGVLPIRRGRMLKSQIRLRKHAKPAYMKSYDN